MSCLYLNINPYDVLDELVLIPPVFEPFKTIDGKLLRYYQTVIK